MEILRYNHLTYFCLQGRDMRILLTGAKGQIGQSIKRHKPENWEMIAADSHTLNITDATAVNNMVHNFEPDIIINAAGYTNLDAAERDKEQVFAVNAEGTRILAHTAAEVGIRFIQLSSDYVFDGQKRVPYMETDFPNPLSTYAKSKLAGELLALSENPDSIIIRSSWVFSEFGNNVVVDLVKRALANQTIEMSVDKIGCPTYAGDLARLMIDLAKDNNAPRGIFHFCGDKAVNRYEFAQVVLQEVAQYCDTSAQLVALPIQEQESTPRPPYSVLSCEKIRALGHLPSNWQTAIKRIVPHLIQAA